MFHHRKKLQAAVKLAKQHECRRLASRLKKLNSEPSPDLAAVRSRRDVQLSTSAVCRPTIIRFATADSEGGGATATHEDRRGAAGSHIRHSVILLSRLRCIVHRMWPCDTAANSCHSVLLDTPLSHFSGNLRPDEPTADDAAHSGALRRWGGQSSAVGALRSGTEHAQPDLCKQRSRQGGSTVALLASLCSRQQTTHPPMMHWLTLCWSPFPWPGLR